MPTKEQQTAERERRLGELQARLDGIAVERDADLVQELSLDTYWKAHALRAAGRPLVADAVVRPHTAHGVAQVLAAASEVGIPVVPRAGGSGSQGGAVPDRGGIVVDVSLMDQILGLDERSGLVRVQPGVNGLQLEEWLNERGFMFPHYPASVHLAQVGGYLAAKGSGVMSTKYGKIEDLVASVEVALPNGRLIRTVAVPRHAVGPDLVGLFIGSEGTLGIITETTLLVRRLPERRAFRTVAFPDVGTGVEALRGALQAGWRPAVARLHDAEATTRNLAQIFDIDVSGVKMLLMFDGPAALVEVEERETVAALVAAGGVDEGPEIAETWWNGRYKTYYPPYKPELPQIWGTADIVATYDRILPAYEALRAFMRDEYRDYDLSFSGHFSHWYPWGAMVYGRFVVERPPADAEAAIALYDDIWRRSSEILMAEGAVINDHHGIGLKLAADVAMQWGSSWEVLQTIKHALDPAGVANPGKLGL
jgi:alkyldihydroxyacetonephosphate synthase